MSSTGLRAPGRRITEGGGCAAAHSRDVPRMLRARPSGVQVQSIATRRPAAALDSGASTVPGAGRAGRPGLPLLARGTRTSSVRQRTNELVFDKQGKTKNYKKPVRGSLHTSRGLPGQLRAAACRSKTAIRPPQSVQMPMTSQPSVPISRRHRMPGPTRWNMTAKTSPHNESRAGCSMSTATLQRQQNMSAKDGCRLIRDSDLPGWLPGSP